MHLPRRLLFLACAALAVLPARASAASANANADFRGGVKAYVKADYVNAAELFERSLRESESASARHNLGLTLFRQGKTGEAAWQLERALILEPLNVPYRTSLEALRGQLGLSRSGPNWLAIASGLLPLNTWLIAASVSFWLLAALIVLPRLAESRPRFIRRTAAWVCALVLLVSATAAFERNAFRHTGLFTTTEPAELRAAPAASAPVEGLARPAERARVKREHGGYFEVRTESGTTGWVSPADFRPLFD